MGLLRGGQAGLRSHVGAVEVEWIVDVLEGADGSGWVEVCNAEHVDTWRAVCLREVHGAEFAAANETDENWVAGSGAGEELGVECRHRDGAGEVVDNAGLGTGS